MGVLPHPGLRRIFDKGEGPVRRKRTAGSFTSPVVKFPLTGPFRSLQPPIFCLTNFMHTDIAFTQMST